VHPVQLLLVLQQMCDGHLQTCIVH
jgi:hypothetical protein